MKAELLKNLLKNEVRGPESLKEGSLDWITYSHTNSSMLLEGVYPDDMPKDELEIRIKGTFGGRFCYRKDGRFKYIAYTD